MIKLELSIKNWDALPVDEVVDWINRGMQDYCEFDYCEIELLNDMEGLLSFEMRILIEGVSDDSQAIDCIIKALDEYCDFEDVNLQPLEVHEAMWVNDDYSLPDSN